MVWKRLYTLVAAVVFTIALAIFAVGTNYISDVWASLPGTNFTGDVNVDGNLTLTTPCANGYALDGTATCAYTGTYDGDLNQDGLGKNSTNWTRVVGETFNATDTAYAEDTIFKGPTTDVRSYGIYPDDSVNDAAKINAMITAKGTNEHYFFPCGTYNLESAITVAQAYVTIVGEGWCTIFKPNNNANITAFNIQASGLTFKDFKIDGNAAYQSKDKGGFSSGWGANDGKIQNVWVYRVTGSCISLNGVNDWIVKDNLLEWCGNHTAVTSASSGMGVQLNSVERVIIDNNIISGVYGQGGIFTADTSTASGNEMKAATISQNIIRNVYRDQGSGIFLYAGSAMSIIGNSIYENPDTAHGTNGIYMSGTSNQELLTVSGNNMYSISGVGIEIGSDRTTVVGNTMWLVGNGSDANGIYVGAPSAVVSGNTIYNATRHGIYISTSGSGSLVTGNIISSVRNSGAGIRLVVEAKNLTDVTISNNIVSDATYGVFKSGSLYLINSTVYGNNYFDVATKETVSTTYTDPVRLSTSLMLGQGASIGCTGSCETGQLGWNTTHICVCTTTNTWEKVAIS